MNSQGMINTTAGQAARPYSYDTLIDHGQQQYLIWNIVDEKIQHEQVYFD
jgi:hypothetical protein